MKSKSHTVSSSPTFLLFLRPLHLSPSLDLSVFPSASIDYTKGGNGCFLTCESTETAAEYRTTLLAIYPNLVVDFVVPHSPPPTLPVLSLPIPVLPAPQLVPGLAYTAGFISAAEETAILRLLDEDCGDLWDARLQRRVMHFGRTFDYATKSMAADTTVPAIPALLAALLGRAGVAPVTADLQLTVNEYPAGKQVGISPHCDTHSSIGDSIWVVSLGGPIVFDLKQKEPATHLPLWVEPRSLLVLAGEARFGWTHGIARRDCDRDLQGELVKRERRVSLTFRHVRAPDFVCKCDYPELCDSRVALKLPTRAAVWQEGLRTQELGART